MLEKLKNAKEIVEVQGFRKLLKKTTRWYCSSDNDSEIKEVIKKYSDKYKIFIDVGAGTGEIICDVGKYFSKSICIEPAKNNFQELIKNVHKMNLKNVSTLNLALGEKTMKKEFMVFSSMQR